MECNTEIGRHIKKSDENKLKDYSYWERLEKLGISTLLERRMGGDLIETYKIMEFLIIVDIFSSQIGNLLSKQISKTKSINQLDFLANRVICFWNKLTNQINNSNSTKNLKIK